MLTLLLLPAAAAAQDVAAAETLFNSGAADMAAGRYQTGCKALSESHRLDPRAGTLFTLARCERNWGHIATAVTRYGDYMNLYDRLPDDKKAEPVQAARYKEATEMREQLLPEVPQLTLSLPKGSPPGTVVKRDGETLGEAALGTSLPIDPGEHTLSTQAPGGPVWEHRVTLARGEKKVVALEVRPVPAPSSPPPDAPSPPRSHTGPIVAFGAGAAGLALGVGFGAAALSKRADLDSACPHHDCPPTQQGNLDDTKTFAHISTAGFVVAGVGAAVGVVLLLLPLPGADKTRKVGVRLGAGYAGFEGTF